MERAPALFARVILDSPLPQLDHPFDYRVPDRLREDITVGQKVVVPLRTGKRRCDAWVIELTSESEFGKQASEVESIVSSVAMLPPLLYRLARTVADRQAGSAVDVLRLAIPSRYVRAEGQFLANATGAFGVPEAGPANKEYVQHSGGVIELTSGDWVPRWCVDTLSRADEQLRAGRSTICVVPDFRDLENLMRAVRAAGLTQHCVRLDAGQSGQDRWTSYLRILSGEALIVVGNRSSVYAPVPHLGLIQIWDDANDGLHEPLAPYAHPRDVALVRQSLENCSLVISSLVPSVPVARLISIGYLSTSRDVRQTPKIIPTDSLTVASAARIPAVVFTHGREAIARGPVLVQVAKPGYASSLRCSACRTRATCSACSGPLKQARAGGPLSCRWCGRIEATFSCSMCAGTTVAPLNSGGEKIAEELGRAFPGARVMAVDSSSAADLGVEGKTLVIATPGCEPVAVGGYAAVFVLDGELARGREDMDADVDALTQWMTAASLAREDAQVYVSGTGEVLGRVIATGDLLAFVTGELKSREALGLPPSTRVAVLTGDIATLDSVRGEIEALPHRNILGPVPVDADASRLIFTFDYRDGSVVASGLRSLIVRTATVPRKPAGKTVAVAVSRVSRLSVRMDDAWLTLH